MLTNLKRRYGTTNLHFITFTCYRRLPFLRTARARNVFLIALNYIHASALCSAGVSPAPLNCRTPFEAPGLRRAVRVPDDVAGPAGVDVEVYGEALARHAHRPIARASSASATSLAQPIQRRRRDTI